MQFKFNNDSIRASISLVFCNFIGVFRCIRSTIRAPNVATRGYSAMTKQAQGAYGADDDLVDYILGITFEIWEERGVGLISQYYSPETVVYALDGITIGSDAMIAGTYGMLEAFPDRLLLGDDVIGKGDSHSGYSSHRVLSPMTNTGDSSFGPATGRQVRIMNMADCVVEEGVIVREWLARDNLALVRQLGFDATECAGAVRGRYTNALTDWFASEGSRLASAQAKRQMTAGMDAQELMHALWCSGDETSIESAYHPYAVMHRSPVETISGRKSLSAHYARLRAAFACSAVSVDHVCEQSAGNNADHVAVRWAVSATHTGDYLGIRRTGKPVLIMGVTHRRIVDGSIAVEWTVFDSLGVMAQLL
jgi:predicted ester cyclase